MGTWTSMGKSSKLYRKPSFITKGFVPLLSNEIPYLYPEIPINPCWLNMGFPLIQSLQIQVTNERRPKAMYWPHGYGPPRWHEQSYLTRWFPGAKMVIQWHPCHVTQNLQGIFASCTMKKPYLWVTWNIARVKPFGCLDVFGLSSIPWWES